MIGVCVILLGEDFGVFGYVVGFDVDGFEFVVFWIFGGGCCDVVFFGVFDVVFVVFVGYLYVVEVLCF